MRKKKNTNQKEYWATKDTDEIGHELVEKVTQYYRFLQQSGRLALYRRAYQMYYSPALEGGQVNFTGQQGELVQLTVNDFRNLLKHLHTLTTTQRPAFECRATNTDHKSEAQCILGQALLDYYLREKKLEVYLKTATELALLYGEGFISTVWNATEGQQYGRDPETGAVIYDGDIAYRTFSRITYAQDFAKDSPWEHYWGIPCIRENKYELAAKYPEYEDEIVSLDMSPDIFDGVDIFWDYFRSIAYTYDIDDIPTFTFYHKPCETLPQGRLVYFLSDGTVLSDEPMPYKDIPIYRVACSEWHGTPFGYTTAYDLMPVQEMTDALDSAICSNQNAFSVINIWAPPGEIPEASNIAGGLRLLQCPQKPEVLELLGTNAEVFTYRNQLREAKQQLAGIDQVTTGSIQKDLSGSAMALLQATSVQFSMDLQQSYAALLEDVGTATLDRLRVFAKVPRVAAIAGKNNKQYMKEFVGDDINLVNRVLVDMGNPLMNTTSGKMNLADQLLNHNLIQTPEEYLSVYTTGRLEPLYESLQSELMLIHQENETLSQGQVPAVLITDNPLLHLKEHQIVANSTDSRNDPSIMQAYTQHIQDHINKWKGSFDPQTGQWMPGIDPNLASLLGIPVPPPPPQELSPVQPAGHPPQGQPNQGPPKGLPPNAQKQLSPAANAMNAQHPITQEAAQVKKPKMPNIPQGAPPQAKAAAQQIQQGPPQ